MFPIYIEWEKDPSEPWNNWSDSKPFKPGQMPEKMELFNKTIENISNFKKTIDKLNSLPQLFIAV